MTVSSVDRYLDCLLGLACGDAVGTTVEFCSLDSFSPVTDMRGGGPFHLLPGQWTDDTAMALCLGQSLVDMRGFDASDQMERYCRWFESGYMSCTGDCFDIGNTVRSALLRYKKTGNAFAGSEDPATAGNGAIMRLAPIPMFYANSHEKTVHFSALASKTTHAAMEAVECASLFGTQLQLALNDAGKRDILFDSGFDSASRTVKCIADGDYEGKARSRIKGSGYVVESLEAALWCFLNAGSYEETVLMATNLGDDADTTAAIAGQIAGAHYGIVGIPDGWLEKLAMREEIAAMAMRLLELREPN